MTYDEEYETYEEYRLRRLKEEHDRLVEDLAAVGLTVEELHSRVPLNHNGPGGCDGVDRDEAYRQIADLLLVADRINESQRIEVRQLIADSAEQTAKYEKLLTSYNAMAAMNATRPADSED